MGNCAVIGCRPFSKLDNPKNDKRVRFFPFPKEQPWKDIWITFTRRGSDFEVTSSSGICEEHFSRADFNVKKKNKILKKEAVPTIFKRETSDGGLETVVLTFDRSILHYLDADTLLPPAYDKEKRIQDILEKRNTMVKEILQSCRFCSESEKDLLPINKLEDYTINPTDMINFLGIASDKNFFSDLICEECFQQIITLDAYGKRCQRAQHNLIEEIKVLEANLEKLDKMSLYENLFDETVAWNCEDDNNFSDDAQSEIKNDDSIKNDIKIKKDVDVKEENLNETEMTYAFSEIMIKVEKLDDSVIQNVVTDNVTTFHPQFTINYDSSNSINNDCTDFIDAIDSDISDLEANPDDSVLKAIEKNKASSKKTLIDTAENLKTSTARKRKQEKMNLQDSETKPDNSKESKKSKISVENPTTVAKNKKELKTNNKKSKISSPEDSDDSDFEIKPKKSVTRKYNKTKTSTKATTSKKKEDVKENSVADKAGEKSNSEKQKIVVKRKPAPNLKSHECYFCGLKYAGKVAFKGHRNVCEQKTVICEFENCGKTFSSLSGINMHNLHIHKLPKISRFFCTCCRTTMVKSEEDFNQHFRLCESNAIESVSNQSATCDKCEKVYPSQRHLAAHMMFHSIPTKKTYKKKAEKSGFFICDTCGKNFPFRSYLRDHIRRMHPPPNPNPTVYECDYCGTTRNYRRLISKHIRNVHRQDISTCPHCGKIFRNKSLLQSHMIYHQDSKRIHFCPMCPTRPPYAKAIGLRRHQEAVHGLGPGYHCEICFKNFKLPGTLANHKFLVHKIARTRVQIGHATEYAKE
ncbi:CLUMA_CG020945, isoform A [Clunio marinus]|uniref:CLUMA_CG020945, isoform A n=1 Tax=Clunio marinus TaxID=568069 RepID=A0A1J1J825_9DIPT|nr:CLUMA_CG020945, isoform A [Clunio marinus]